MGIITDKINDRVAEALLQIEKHAAEVATGLAQWQNGNRLTGARPLTIGGHPRLWGAGGRLVGWSVYADGGPVTVLVRDTREADSGDVLAVIRLESGQDSQQWTGPTGVSFGWGLYLQQVAGAGKLVGSVWLGAVD